MAEWSTESLILIALAIGLSLLLVVLWRRRVRRRDPVERKLRRAGRDVLSNFVIPDGDNGEIHLEYAMLTHRGVVVLDTKDVAGHVFGSDNMDDWTVISDDRRYTFSNPQPALFDRVAAVKRLIPDSPVLGYIAFSSRAQFTKGRPRAVVNLDGLLDEITRERSRAQDLSPEDYRAQWERLRHEAVTARFGALLGD